MQLRAFGSKCLDGEGEVSDEQICELLEHFNITYTGDDSLLVHTDILQAAFSQMLDEGDEEDEEDADPGM